MDGSKHSMFFFVKFDVRLRFLVLSLWLDAFRVELDYSGPLKLHAGCTHRRPIEVELSYGARREVAQSMKKEPPGKCATTAVTRLCAARPVQAGHFSAPSLLLDYEQRTKTPMRWMISSSTCAEAAAVVGKINLKP